MNLLPYKKSCSKRILICCILCINLFSSSAFSQQRKYNVTNAHAHNDYINHVPFYTAFNAGFGSIEADIFPVNGILCVAHSKNEIQSHRTLKNLYLDPLMSELSPDTSRRLKLLVDIKEDYKTSLQLLIRDIEPLKQYLSTPQKSRSLTILVSGKRPPPAEYKNYPDYIFFDDHLTLHHDAAEWERVGQVSLSFAKLSAWRGEGPLEKKEKKLLKRTIDSVHRAGKTIRFWAAPDNEDSWKMQMELGVDLVGTDKVNELAKFLRSISKKK